MSAPSYHSVEIKAIGSDPSLVSAISFPMRGDGKTVTANNLAKPPEAVGRCVNGAYLDQYKHPDRSVSSRDWCVMAAPTTRWTLAEFNAWERTQDERYEFVDGQPVMMTGITLAANLIRLNITGALRPRMWNRGCEVFGRSAKLVVGEDAFYPDVMVVCGGFDRTAASVDTATILFEELSNSTVRYESGLRFLKYQRVPSLKYFVIVAEAEHAVQVYSRREEGWWDWQMARFLRPTRSTTPYSQAQRMAPRSD